MSIKINEIITMRLIYQLNNQYISIKINEIITMRLIYQLNNK